MNEFAKRRAEFIKKIGNGTAIFRSAPTAIMHHDVEYTYRQDSSLYYLTGFHEENSVAVLAPHHEEHKFIMFVRPKNPEKEIWSGYRVGIEQAKELYNADAVFDIKELDEQLPKYLRKADRLYYHFGPDQNFNNKIIKLWQNLLSNYGKFGTGPKAIEDPLFVLYPMRITKSQQEISLIKKAVEIAVKAHNHAQEITRPGRYEYEIQAEIEHIFRLNGGSPAYPSIVASGENACILHYINNNRQIQESDLLLIDAGCCYQYYNSDITRTFPVSGKYSSEQKILYDLVKESQKQAIDLVKPHQPFNAFHETAVNVLVDGFLELGLLTGSKEEIIKCEKYKHLYMHRTGHWLGLDVHDMGLYKNGSDTWENFQPNQIVTVEPGIYINPHIKPPEGQPEIPNNWKGIGIRIEDDILVTPDGNQVLTDGVPK